MFALFFLVPGCRTTSTSSSDVEIPAGPQQRATLRVATSGDYPPFSDWPASSAAPTGFSISVAEAYADEAERRVEWVRFRWPELANDLTAGAFDFAISGITVRPDRSMQGRFGIPLTTSGAVVLVEAESSLVSAKDLDRPSTRIAVNAGGHLEKVARRLFPSAQLEAIPMNADVLGQLLLGRAEAVVTDTLEVIHWRRDAGMVEMREIGPLTRDHKAAWFPLENGLEVHRFNRWLLAAETTGLLDRLRKEHGLPEERTANPLSALLSSLGERLSLMNAVADAKRVLGTPIENPEREEVVLDAAVEAIREAAEDRQIVPPDSDSVRRLFRAQIEAAKWIQIRHLGRSRVEDEPRESATTQSRNRQRAREKLDEVIRPALIDLGQRISMLVLVCAADAPIPLSENEVARALESRHLPDTHIRAIYDALSEIVTRERTDEPARRPSRARTDTAPSGSRQTMHP